MNKIRKGDEVIVITGRDKGKRGKVVAAQGRLAPGGRGRQRGEEARQAEPDEGRDRRHRRQDHADPPVQRGHLQCRPPARLTASASSCWRTARGFASSSNGVVSRRRNQGGHDHGTSADPVTARRSLPELMAKFGYKSSMQVPRLTKITLNMGVSEAVADKKVMDNAVGDLTKIAGQKPVVTKCQEGDRRSSRSAKTWPSAAWSRCVACRCTSSWTVS